jgi:hypothetical protein
MYPDDIEDYDEATEGEKRVFRFIKEAARPHKDFIRWYESPIGILWVIYRILLKNIRFNLLIAQ